MARKPETGLMQRTRRRLVQEVGGWWFKVHGGPYQQAGIPDLIGCVEGLFFSFEGKVGRNKADALQEATMEAIRVEGGGVSIVIYDPQEAVDAVKEALAKAGRVPTKRRRVRPKLPNGVRIIFRARDR